MKKIFIILLIMLGASLPISSQDIIHTNRQHDHANDTTDVFFRHLEMNEVTVTGVTGDTKMKHSTAPVSIVSAHELRSTASANIIDAISHQPGVSQLTTGSSISKPIIRGLGYNRIVVMSEGVRQEGQQWGDEHGVEVDGCSVGSVEILKGPASLMYGSDAMAGVVLLHPQPTLADGDMSANVSSEYQTNNGLFGLSVSLGGNHDGFVWNATHSQKKAHAYKNKYDGYVPGSQYSELADRIMVGLNKGWGQSRLTLTSYQLTPGIVEGERNLLTGELVPSAVSPKSYSKSLPFQQVRHYKVVWDNSLNLTSGGYLKTIIGYQQNRRQEFEESMDEYGIFLKLHTLTYDMRLLTDEFSGWKLSTGIGGMYQQSVNKGEEYLIPDSRLFDFGLYATASKNLGYSWTLNGGVRYDHRWLHGDELMDGEAMRFTDFSRHFNGFTGSIGVVCNISEHFNLRMNLARGFRTPNMSELASNGVHEGSVRYEIGSTQLKAEYSLQADLGLDFSLPCVSGQLALFANRIDNYIFTRRNPVVMEEGYLTYAYTQGDARLIGFEAGVDFHPVHSVHFSNTFSFVDAQLLHADADAKYLPFTPAPRWTSELKWELFHHSHSTVNHPHHSANHIHRSLLNNLYIATELDCYLKQTHIYRADETETATPAYALLNLSAGTDIQVKGRKVCEFYLTAHNLFDKAYQSHLSRLKYADENVVTGRTGVYNMGRNITFKLVVPIKL